MPSRERSRAAGENQLALGGQDVSLPPGLDEGKVQAKLASASEKLRTAVELPDAAWVGSTYEWVRQLPPTKRSRVGVELVGVWAETVGVPLGPKWSGGVMLASFRTVVKTSTRWSDGNYVYQLPLPDRAQQVVLLGVSPNKLDLWVVPPEVLHAHSETVGGAKQWVTLDATNPPAWINIYGGGLLTPAEMLAQNQDV